MLKQETYSDASLSSFSRAAVHVAWIVAFAALTAVAAHVAIPVPGTVVPMTMQTAVVLAAGLWLGARDGAASQLVYLASGVAGFPVFAGGSMGAMILAGPTGGYLWGFVLAAFAAGALRGYARGVVRTWLAVFAASLVLFIPGVLQLKLVTGCTWFQAWSMGVVPFILGDLLKVSLTSVSSLLKRGK